MDVFKTLLVDSPQVLADGTGLLLASNNLNDLDDASTARTNLGVAIGSDVQAHDADLDSWAGVTRASGFDTFAATPSSANLAGLVSDETGSGALVFANSPTLVTPALGTPASGVVTNLTGTASININGTVGATTPASGTFTTLLSTTGTVTGRMIADTGDARVYFGTTTNHPLQFQHNGTNVGQLTATGLNSTAIGATTPSTGAFTTLNTSGAVVFNEAGANVDFRVEGDTQPNLLFVDASADNVGIGTNSPANKLQVRADNGDVLALQNNTVGSAASPALTRLMFNGFANSPKAAIHATDESANFDRGQLIFATKDNAGSVTEKVRIDSAGNVGIGTTSPGVKLDVAGTINSTGLAVTGALSSTTGANFATSSGDVGIGTASPAAKLHVRSSSTSVVELLRLDNPANAGDNGAKITWANADQANDAGFISVVRPSTTLAQDMIFATSANWVTTAPSEKVRITGAGNVGIGTTTPANLLHVKSSASSTVALFGDSAANNTLAVTRTTSSPAYLAISATSSTGNIIGGPVLRLLTAGADGSGDTERARIDASGNVGIGTASPGSKLDVNGELRIGNTVNTVSPTSPDRTITMVIGGTTYYIHAKTTND